jgi:hypothetical protein
MFNSTKHTKSESRERPRRRLSYANVASTLSVFLVVAGGTALAASLPANSVKSKTVKDNSLKSVDLRDDAAVASPDVVDDSLTGADITESTLAQVPDSARLQGRSAASFLSTSVYKTESAIGPGQTLGDGTQVDSAACNPGDILLSGGPANIRDTTDLLESFPSPGNLRSWSVRVHKNGQTDNFNTVVLCIDQ